MRRRRVENVSAAERLRARLEQWSYGDRKWPPGPRWRARSRRKPTTARAESQFEASVRDQVEHRRVFGDPDWLVERQSHDASTKTNSRCARRDMREKHKRGGKTAFVPIKVMLSDPGRVKAVSLRVNDLLRSEPIALSCGRLIEKPSEETEPSWSRRRHVDVQPQSFSSERSAGVTWGRPTDRTLAEAKN
jgi:hypothetical protein